MYTHLENLAYRAKEVLGSKLAELSAVEAKSFYDLHEYFLQKDNEMRIKHARDIQEIMFEAPQAKDGE